VCKKDAKTALEKVSGVKSVDFNGNAIVVGGSATGSSLTDALYQAGFYARAEKPATETKVTGDRTFSKFHSCCTKCERGIMEAIGSVPGVEAARYDKAAKTLTVTCNLEKATVDKLRAAAEGAGFAGEWK
jgi:copper chaperone CopZ